MQPFAPNFDDCQWQVIWMSLPLIQAVPGRYRGFTVRSWRIDQADVCGRTISLPTPLDIRGLLTDDGTLWMSDVPQERLMMSNNAFHSAGRVLVGGLGLGLYPQYALIRAADMAPIESITVIEREPALAEVVEPLVQIAAAPHGVPVRVELADVQTALEAGPSALYDTIFLDTWSRIDPALLPEINALRDLALRHLEPGGRVLLWGYNWMLRLFLGGCLELFAAPPEERPARVEQAAAQRPGLRALLEPVLARFPGPVDDLPSAQRWCREHALRVTLP